MGGSRGLDTCDFFELTHRPPGQTLSHAAQTLFAGVEKLLEGIL